MHLKKKIKNKIFVVVGDGECNEGSNWESLMTAAHYQLDNLIIFIDKNNFQQTGTCDDILRTGNLSKKFESFNCFSQEIDGHDHFQIYKGRLFQMHYHK